jgi:hypothetical protein
MKKIILWALAGVLAVAPSVASAQSASGTVNASATILAYLDVQNISDMDFGNVTAGTAATLTPGSTPASGTLGVLEIDHNSDVSVSASLPSGGLSLVGNPTAPKLPVTFSCGYSDAQSGALSGSATACTSLPNRSGNGDGTTTTSYIQVGGSITSTNTTGRIPGTYTGSLVFTVPAVY